MGLKRYENVTTGHRGLILFAGLLKTSQEKIILQDA